MRRFLVKPEGGLEWAEVEADAPERAAERWCSSQGQGFPAGVLVRPTGVVVQVAEQTGSCVDTWHFRVRLEVRWVASKP